MINREVFGKRPRKAFFQVGKYANVCSNHFAFGRSTDSSPHPTLYLRGCDRPRGASKSKRKRLDRTNSHNSLEWSSSPSASQSTTKVMPKEQLDARSSSSSVGNSADEHQSLIATADVAEPSSPIEKQSKPSPPQSSLRLIHPPSTPSLSNCHHFGLMTHSCGLLKSKCNS